MNALPEIYDEEPRREGAELSRAAIAALVLATLLAGVLRLLHLGEWSIWVDEAHSFRDATVPWDGPDGFRNSPRSNYPVSYLLLRWYLDFLGMMPREGWLRLPFAFVGTVTVPLLALVAKPIVGIRVGLFAAFLLAVNPWHLFWSQNIRSYVLVVFFALAGMGMVWRALTMGGLTNWFVAAFLLLLAGFTHSSAFGLFVVVAVIIIFDRIEQERLRSAKLWLWIAVGAVVVFLALQLAHLSPTFQTFARAKPDASLLHLIETSAFYFRVPIIVTAFVGLWFLMLDKDRAPLLFLGAWILVPAVGLAVFGSIYVKATARYGLFALPAVLVLASVAVSRLCSLVLASYENHRWLVRWLPAGLLPALLLADSVSYDVLYHTVQQGDRPRWREAANWVKEDTGAGTAVIFSTNQPTMVYYFTPEYWRQGSNEDARGPWQLSGLEPWTYKAIGGPIAHIRELIAEEERDGGYRGPGLYAIVTRPELQEMDPDGELERYLRETFHQTASFPAWVGPKDHTVYVFVYRGT